MEKGGALVKYWVVLTAKGAFRMDGRSVLAALSRFNSAHKGEEVCAVVRSDMIVMPPEPGDGLPFKVMAISATKRLPAAPGGGPK
jgi:hypothetical protein